MFTKGKKDPGLTQMENAADTTHPNRMVTHGHTSRLSATVVVPFDPANELAIYAQWLPRCHKVDELA